MDALREKLAKAVENNNIFQSSMDNMLLWLTEARYASFKDELFSMIEEEKWEDLNDAFYQVIPFGTAGRRGPVGIGPNRMNEITIAEGAQGVADYVLARVKDRQPRVVIAYDVRLTSLQFAEKTAAVFAGNGFKTFLFEEFRATPELSFAVRHLNCDAGVVVSASHNPPQDNGFKAYGPDGGQVAPQMGRDIIECVKNVSDIKEMPIDQARSEGLVEMIGKDVDDAYYSAILNHSLTDQRDLKIAYSPIHGTGLINVGSVLDRAGFNEVNMVASQKEPDGHFPNVKDHIANPEVPTAMEEVINYGERIKADVAFASDPDADRLAIAAPLTFGGNGKMKILTGNQTGALLGHYVLEHTKRKGALRPDYRVYTTCVTSPMLPVIARDYGVNAMDNLLVGFKYVAEQIAHLDDPEDFLFGTEESIGYMKGPYTRDKDAAMAALLTCECAAALKAEGKTMWQGLFDLYRTYGYFAAIGKSVFLTGLEGKARMAAILDSLRNNPPETIANERVTAVIDRLNLTRTDLVTGETAPYDVPMGHKDNLIIWELNGDLKNRVAIRPSGTEPKIKFYYMLYSPSDTQEPFGSMMADTDQRMTALIKAVEEMALSRG